MDNNQIYRGAVDLRPSAKPTPPPTLPIGESNLIYNTFGSLSDEDRKRREALMQEMQRQKELMSSVTGEVNVEGDRIYSHLDPKLFAGNEDENRALLAKGLNSGGLTTKIVNGQTYVFPVDPKTNQRGDLALAEVGSDGNIQKMRYTENAELDLGPLGKMRVPFSTQGINPDALEKISTGEVTFDKNSAFLGDPLGLDKISTSIGNVFTEEDKSRINQGYYPKSWEDKEGNIGHNWWETGRDIGGAVGTAVVTGGLGAAPYVAGATSALPFAADYTSQADRGQITPSAAIGKTALDVASGAVGGQVIPNLTKGALKEAGKKIGGMAAADMFAGAGHSVIDQTQAERRNGFTTKDASTDYLNAQTGLGAIIGGIFSGVVNTGSAGLGTVASKMLNNKIAGPVNASNPNKAVVTPDSELKNFVQKQRDPVTGQTVDNPQSLAQANEVEEMVTAAANEVQASGNTNKGVEVVKDPITGKLVPVYKTGEVVATASRWVEDATAVQEAIGNAKANSSIIKLAETNNMPVAQKTIDGLTDKAIASYLPEDKKIAAVARPIIIGGPDVVSKTADGLGLTEGGLSDVINAIASIEKGTWVAPKKMLENPTTNNLQEAANGNTSPEVTTLAKVEAITLFQKAENTLAKKIENLTGKTEEEAKQEARTIMIGTGGDKTTNYPTAVQKFVEANKTTDPAILQKKLDDLIIPELDKVSPELTSKVVAMQADDMVYPDELVYPETGFNDTKVQAEGYNSTVVNGIIPFLEIDDIDGAVQVAKDAGLPEPAAILAVSSALDSWSKIDNTVSTKVDGKKFIDWPAVEKAKSFDPKNVITPVILTYNNQAIESVPTESIVPAGVTITGNNHTTTKAIVLSQHKDMTAAGRKEIFQSIVDQNPDLTLPQVEAIAAEIKNDLKAKKTEISVDEYLKPNENQTLTVADLNKKLTEDAQVRKGLDDEAKNQANKDEQKAKADKIKAENEAKTKASTTKTNGNPAKSTPKKQVKTGKSIITYVTTDKATNLLFDRIMATTDATEFSQIASELAPRFGISENRMMTAIENIYDQRRLQEEKIEEAELAGLTGTTPNSDGFFEFKLTNPFDYKETAKINSDLLYNDNLKSLTTQSPSVTTDGGTKIEFKPFAVGDLSTNYTHGLLNYNREATGEGQAVIIDQLFAENYGLTAEDITSIQLIVAQDIQTQYMVDAAKGGANIKPKYTVTKEAQARVKNVVDKGKIKKASEVKKPSPSRTGQQIATASIPFMFAPFDEDKDSDFTLYASIPMLMVLGSKFGRKAIKDGLIDTKLGSKIASGHVFDPETYKKSIIKSPAYNKEVTKIVSELTNNNATPEEIDAALKDMTTTYVDKMLAEARKLDDPSTVRGTTAQKALKNEYWAHIYNSMGEADRIAGDQIKPVSGAIANFTKGTPAEVKNGLLFGNLKAYTAYVDFLKNRPGANATQLEKAEFSASVELFKRDMFDNFIFPELNNLGKGREEAMALWSGFRDIMNAKSLVDINSRVNHELSGIPYQADGLFPQLGNMVSFEDLMQIKPEVTARVEAKKVTVNNHKLLIKNAKQLAKEGQLTKDEAEVYIQIEQEAIYKINQDIETEALKSIAKITAKAERFFEESMSSNYIHTRAADNTNKKNAPYGVTLKAELVDENGNFIRVAPGKMPINFHSKYLNEKDRTNGINAYLKEKGATQDYKGEWFFTDTDGTKYHIREANFNIKDNKGIATQSKEDVAKAIDELIKTADIVKKGTQADVIQKQLNGVELTLQAAERDLFENANRYEMDEFSEIQETIAEGLTALEQIRLTDDIGNAGEILHDLNTRIHMTSSGNNGLGLSTLRHTNADGWQNSISGKPYGADDFLKSFNTQIENQVGAFQKQAALKATHEKLGELKSKGLDDTATGLSLQSFLKDITQPSVASHWALDVAQFITATASFVMIGANPATMAKNFNSNIFYHALANQDIYGGTKAYRLGWDYLSNTWQNREMIGKALTGATADRGLSHFKKSQDYLLNFEHATKLHTDASMGWNEVSLKADLKQNLLDRGVIQESIMGDLSRTPSDNAFVRGAQKVEEYSHFLNRVPDVISRTTMMNNLIDIEVSKMNIDYNNPASVEEGIKTAANNISARIDATFGKFSPLYKSDLERKAMNFGGGVLKPFMLYTGPAAAATHLWIDKYSKFASAVAGEKSLLGKETKKNIGQVGALIALGGLMGGTTFLQGINDAYNFAEVFKGAENDQDKLVPETMDGNFVTKIENDVRAGLMENWDMTADEADRLLMVVRKGAPTAFLNRNVAQEESFFQTFSPVMGQVAIQTYDMLKRRDGGIAAAGEKFLLKGVWKNLTTATQNLMRGGTEYKDVEIDGAEYDLMDFAAESLLGPKVSTTTGRTEDWRRNVALTGPANREKFAKTFVSNGGFTINSQLPKDKLIATKEMGELSPLLYNEFVEQINNPKIVAGMEYSTRLLDNVMEESQSELGIILGKGNYTEENQSEFVNRQINSLKRSMSKSYLEAATGRAWEKVSNTKQGKKFTAKYRVAQQKNNANIDKQLIIAQNVLNNVYKGERGKLSRIAKDEKNYGKIALVAGLSKKARTPEQKTALRKLAYRLFEFTE